jgi:hypothetical protein
MINMVIIRLDDLLLHPADDAFPREAARLDSYNEWMQAGAGVPTCDWQGLRV